MKKPELSIAKIDKYYNLRAGYELAVRDYNINPTVINDVHKRKAFNDLLLFCLETVADMSGDREYSSVVAGTRGIDLFG